MEVCFGPLAQRELDIASDFYESRRSGLGDEFLDEVRRHIILLKEHPKLGRRLFLNRRMLKLNRFPYRLVYVQEEQIIRIMRLRMRVSGRFTGGIAWRSQGRLTRSCQLRPEIGARSQVRKFVN